MNIKILNEALIKKPRVTINNEDWLMIQTIVEKSKEEVGWLSCVDKSIEDGIITYNINKVYVPKQDVHAVTCEITDEGLQELYEGFILSGQDEIVNKLRCWGHSHVNMGVSPSSQDETQFLEFSQNCDFFIRLIVNKQDDINISILDKENNLIIDNLDLEVYYENNELKKLYSELNLIYTKMNIVETKIKDEVKKIESEKEETIEKIKKMFDDKKKEVNNKYNSTILELETNEDNINSAIENIEEEYNIDSKVDSIIKENVKKKVYTNTLINNNYKNTNFKNSKKNKGFDAYDFYDDDYYYDDFDYDSEEERKMLTDPFYYK